MYSDRTSVRISHFVTRAGLSQSVAMFQLRISQPPSPPLPLPLYPSSLLIPFPSSLPSLSSPPPRREAATLKPARGLEERCKLPQRGPERSPGRSRILLHCVLAKRIWLQHFWFFGQHCIDWQNESQSRLGSNLESISLYGICRIQNGAPHPKVGGSVRTNNSNMPKAGPVRHVFVEMCRLSSFSL